MKHVHVLSALLLTLVAGGAHAQRLAPGLWEQSMTMGGAAAGPMAQMQKEMAKMSPEQRKQMEAMMASQGMGVGMGAGQPLTVKMCLTAEQVARDEMPQQDKNCRQTSTQRSGNTVRFKFVCEGEPRISGEGEFTSTGNKAHSGRMVMDTQRGGKTERTEMQMAGRWLGADCGTIKPVK
jgi:hypothetical protein